MRVIRLYLALVALLLLHETLISQINTDYFMAVGRTEMNEGNYESAITNFNIVIQYKKDQFEAYLYRGLAKYNLGDLLGAESDFTRAIKLHPLYSHTYHYRGVTRDRLRNFYDALLDLDQAIRLDPFNAEYYNSRGAIKLHMESYLWSISDFDSAVIISPSFADAYMNRAIAKSVLKDNDGALNDCNKAIKLDPYNDAAFLKRGVIFYEMKDYSSAITDFDRAVKLNKDNVYAYFNRAMARYYLGDTTGSVADYTNVIGFDPYNALSYYNRALLKAQQGDPKSALEDFNKVLAINPENVYTYYNRAVTKHQLDDLKGAIQDYTSAIGLLPDFAGAYLNRSEAKRTLGDEQGAWLDYEKAYQIIESLNTGEVDSAMLIKKYSDSTYFDKIMEFEAEFARVDLEGTGSRQIELEPNFSLQYVHDDLIYLKESREGYYVKQIADLNKNNKYGLRFTLTNDELDLRLEDAFRQLVFADSILDKEEGPPMSFLFKGVINNMVKNYNTAIQEYSEALRSDPSLTLAYVNRSNLLMDLADKQFLEAYYSNSVVISWGEQEQQSVPSKTAEYPDYTEALKDIEKALKLQPDLPFTYFNRGNIRNKMRDYNGAILDYTQAITLQVNFAEAYFNRGLTYLIQGQDQQACADLSKAGELGIKKAYSVITKYCNK